MIMEYQKKHRKETGDDLYFPEALKRMYQENLLSEIPLPMPRLSGVMSKEEFQKAYNQVPFEAMHILKNPSPNESLSERTIFPENKDIYCLQHMYNISQAGFYSNTYFSLTYIYRGSCEFYFENNERRTLKEGDVCIVSPNSRHCISSHEETFAFYIIIRKSSFLVLFNEFLTNDTIHADFFRNALSQSNDKNFIIINTDKDDEELTTYLQAMSAECYKDDPVSNICAISLLKLFFANTVRKYGEHVTMYDPKFLHPDRDLNLILQYIANNYQHLTLKKLAEHFHYNPSYVSRMLHKSSKKSFSEIITDLRVANARSYLDNTDKNIQEIASIVGYNSPDHFSKSFKKITGLSPSAYRKKA